MDKGKVSLKSVFGRSIPAATTRFKICSRIALLLIAAIPGTVKAAAPKSLNCFDACEQSLSNCVQQSNGNPTLEARCQDTYDFCVEQCMINP